IYAVGVILYELVTGRVPFWGAAADVRVAHGTRRVCPPSQFVSLPSRLEELILRCLAKDPADRPECIAAVRDELGEAALQAATRGRVDDPAPRAVPTSGPASSQSRQFRAVLFLRANDAGAVRSLAAEENAELVYAEGRRCVVALAGGPAGQSLARAIALARRAASELGVPALVNW